MLTIFLALSTNKDNIYLLREAQEFDRKSKNKEVLNYVDINVLKSLFGIINYIP